MHNYTDNQILQGIKEHDNTILKYLYKEYFAYVKSFIVRNSGSEDEAKDLFQEAIIILYRKISDGQIELKKSFRSYFTVMIKYLWFKKLERNPQISDDQEYIENIEDDNEELTFKIEEARKYSLFQKHFNKLRDDCKQILTLFLQKIPLKVIADRLGSKSENYIKKRKHKCKEFLVDSIKSDPDYQKIYDS